MIPVKYRSKDLIGRKVVFERDLFNGNGNGFSKGTIGIIVNASYGITVKTDPCPHCGQFGYIRKLSREDLSLIVEEGVILR